jgi:hypothetical protein
MNELHATQSWGVVPAMASTATTVGNIRKEGAFQTSAGLVQAVLPLLCCMLEAVHRLCTATMAAQSS